MSAAASADATASERSRRDAFGRVAVVLWGCVAVVVLATLSVSHLVAMPGPSDAERLRDAVASLRRAADRPFLLHVIYRDCSCTDSLFAHLVARGPHQGTEERVLLVGAASGKERSARRAGFAVDVLEREALREALGIEAAPVLVVLDGTGDLRYVGGYYRHPATIAPLDEEIFAAVRSGRPVEPLPVYGCAVSDRLQGAVDPLGLVYRDD